jgi:hypothetical protein
MITLTDCTFAWMRRELALILRVREEYIQSETPLSWLIPAERRREVWQTGEQRLGLQFPILELPTTMRHAGWYTSLLSGVRSALVALCFGANWFALPLGLASFVGWAVLYRLVTTPWRTELTRIETFGDLSRALVARNLPKCQVLFGLQPTREEIFAVVATILEEVGADPDRIKLETPLVQLIEC